MRQLAEKRKRTRWEGFDCIADFKPEYDSTPHVSPYSRFAGNIYADIMILLQDWASSDWLRGPYDADVARLGHDPRIPTNRNLANLLYRHLDAHVEDTYITNVFPFVKRGGMSARVPSAALLQAAREFALPQIDIIRPKLAICMGLASFNAVASACDRPKAKDLNAAIEQSFYRNKTWICCQAHPSQRSQNHRSRLRQDQVDRDWIRLLYRPPPPYEV